MCTNFKVCGAKHNDIELNFSTACAAMCCCNHNAEEDEVTFFVFFLQWSGAGCLIVFSVSPPLGFLHGALYAVEGPIFANQALM